MGFIETSLLTTAACLASAAANSGFNDLFVSLAEKKLEKKIEEEHITDREEIDALVKKAKNGASIKSTVATTLTGILIGTGTGRLCSISEAAEKIFEV